MFSNQFLDVDSTSAAAAANGMKSLHSNFKQGTRFRGFVYWWNFQKGTGFIRCVTEGAPISQDVKAEHANCFFAHYSAIINYPPKCQWLVQGEPVEFELQMNDATNCKDAKQYGTYKCINITGPQMAQVKGTKPDKPQAQAQAQQEKSTALVHVPLPASQQLQQSSSFSPPAATATSTATPSLSMDPTMLMLMMNQMSQMNELKAQIQQQQIQHSQDKELSQLKQQMMMMQFDTKLDATNNITKHLQEKLVQNQLDGMKQQQIQDQLLAQQISMVRDKMDMQYQVTQTQFQSQPFATATTPIMFRPPSTSVHNSKPHKQHDLNKPYKKTPCKHFQKGNCRNGDACTFKHELNY